MNGHPRFVANALVKTLEQSPTTGEHDAAFHQVTGQLRWRLVQSGLHRVNDRRHGDFYGLTDFLAGHHDGLGQARNQVTTADLGVWLVRNRERRSNQHLNFLSRALTEQQRVLLLDVLNNRQVECISTHTNGLRRDNAAQRNHRNFSGSTTDVDHHVASGLVDWKSGANRSSHRLFNDVHLARTGGIPSVFDCALFHTGDARGYTDNDAGLGQVAAGVHLLNEVTQHALSGIEVSDHTVFEWANRHDVAWGAADHLLGFKTHREHATRGLVNGNNGWLVQNHTTTADVHQGVSGTQVNGHVATNK